MKNKETTTNQEQAMRELNFHGLNGWCWVLDGRACSVNFRTETEGREFGATQGWC